jgi:hypothetical protein
MEDDWREQRKWGASGEEWKMIGSEGADLVLNVTKCF